MAANGQRLAIKVKPRGLHSALKRFLPGDRAREG